MARPQKQTVDYFPHDASASDVSDTLKILDGHFGNDGYAFWFRLLEKLSTSDNHVIDCRNAKKWQLLLVKNHLTEETGEAIMGLLADLDAIDAKLWRDYRVIWCQNFVDGVADAYRNRKRPVPERPVITTENPISTTNNGISTPDKPQTKLNYTKLNEILFARFWELYPNKKSKARAEQAFAKIKPDEALLAVILAAIERAKKSKQWTKDNGEFIPYPATWLNARGWEDEINVTVGAKSLPTTEQLEQSWRLANGNRNDRTAYYD